MPVLSQDERLEQLKRTERLKMNWEGVTIGNWISLGQGQRRRGNHQAGGD